jgi:hypothetical protein
MKSTKQYKLSLNHLKQAADTMWMMALIAQQKFLDEAVLPRNQRRALEEFIKCGWMVLTKELKFKPKKPSA